MVIPHPPRILFIDAYDSFSNSIIGLIQESLRADVHVIRIDDGKTADDLVRLTRCFDAVVVGPGPGNPANDQDIGISRFLWTLEEADVIPVLGICLGFQSMGLAFGGQLARLREARHGHVCDIIHTDSDIFTGLGQLRATQYHSLQVVPQRDNGLVSMIQPLAFTQDERNGEILMALKVRGKPFWGLQFHPESICTSENASLLISNWWEFSQAWLRKHRRSRRLSFLSNTARPFSILRPETSGFDTLTSRIRIACPLLFPKHPAYNWKIISLRHLTVPEICERLNINNEETFLLESQGHSFGRFSILGTSQSNEKIELSFRAPYRAMTLSICSRNGSRATDFPVDSQQDVWQAIKEIMAANKIESSAGPVEIPFWGGFIGFMSYEAGLDTLNIPLKAKDADEDQELPDISFTWIRRSVVVDHAANKIYIQQLGPDVEDWTMTTAALIASLAQIRTEDTFQGISNTHLSAPDRTLKQALENVVVEKPLREQYCGKVDLCKEYLAKGESYELCLTDQTKVYLPTTSEEFDTEYDWALYKRLRATNPAPFGTFLRTSDVTIIGSSPERFLLWTRSNRCQFRPIKGTVKKGPGVDREVATKILSSSKERAENLMIVDLIRHDLSGIVGSENCTVPKLMQVEEYETVFQLVSVIEGQLPQGDMSQKLHSLDHPSGIDVLAASLPPGSMTGAPKKRSCELLMQLEGRARGIYSGVVGYIDVGGGGDFSVVIRTAVRLRRETVHRDSSSSCVSSPHQVWRIGAGGAVTIQSTSIGEFEEMETKLDSVLRAFCST